MSQSTPQRMIYQTEQTRHHIMQVAEQVFLERGFFDTQMKHIADAVGMSRNTLYRYFRDKTDLGFAILEAIVSKAVTQFAEAIDNTPSRDYLNHREMLIGIITEALVSHFQEDEIRYIAEFDAYFSGNRIPEDFKAKQNISMWTPVASALTNIVQKGIDEGSIRKDFPPEKLVQVILLAIKLMQQETVTRSQGLATVKQDDAENLTVTLIALLLEGLKPAA